MSTIYERKFNGKRYMLYDAGYYGLKVKRAAKKLRDEGYSVRVVKMKKGEFEREAPYAIYRRHKIKK